MYAVVTVGHDEIIFYPHIYGLIIYMYLNTLYIIILHSVYVLNILWLLKKKGFYIYILYIFIEEIKLINKLLIQ